MKDLSVILLNSFDNIMRKCYLSSLDFAQEYFVESLVISGEMWVINDEVSNTLGYFISNKSTIFEWHLVNNDVDCEDCIGLFKRLGYRFIVLKSFDKITFNIKDYDCKYTACLYRNFDSSKYHYNQAIVLQEEGILSANDEILGAITANFSDFFDNFDEVRDYINIGELILFKHNDQLIGCGIAKQIHPEFSWWDVGMVVREDFRRRNFGSYIVFRMTVLCVSKGRVPVCGCSIDNIGSQLSLKKAGFVQNGHLIKITL